MRCDCAIHPSIAAPLCNNEYDLIAVTDVTDAETTSTVVIVRRSDSSRPQITSHTRAHARHARVFRARTRANETPAGRESTPNVQRGLHHRPERATVALRVRRRMRRRKLPWLLRQRTTTLFELLHELAVASAQVFMASRLRHALASSRRVLHVRRRARVRCR